jgi:hypothetical protein
MSNRDPHPSLLEVGEIQQSAETALLQHDALAMARDLGQAATRQLWYPETSAALHPREARFAFTEPVEDHKGHEWALATSPLFGSEVVSTAERSFQTGYQLQFYVPSLDTFRAVKRCTRRHEERANRDIDYFSIFRTARNLARPDDERTREWYALFPTGTPDKLLEVFPPAQPQNRLSAYAHVYQLLHTARAELKL